MNNKIKMLIITFCIMVLVIIFGCASFQDVITPTYIPPSAIEYADVNVPLIGGFPYTSLFDARTVMAKMDYVHLLNNMTEEAKYNFLKGLTQMHIDISQDFQQKLFSPTGPIGLLLPSSMAAILGLFAGGRFIKSPREKELENEINKNNKTSSTGG